MNAFTSLYEVVSRLAADTENIADCELSFEEK